MLNVNPLQIHCSSDTTFYYDMYLKSNRKWGFSKEYPRTWERATPFFGDINHLTLILLLISSVH